VTFLPQELSSSDERSRMLEFPSDNVSPLVKKNGEISVRVNPLGKTRIHNSLTSRSDGNRLLEISLTRLSNPSNLR
jgi:hypothetical protein